MNRLIIAVALLSASCGAFGEVGDTRLLIHGFSSHLSNDSYYTGDGDEQKSYNEFNPGLGIGYEFVDGISARTGLFQNSFNKLSVYGALNWHTSYARPVAIGLQVGFASGYNNTPQTTGDAPVMAIVLPTLSAGVESFRVELGYIPAFDKVQSDVVILSFNIKF